MSLNTHYRGPYSGKVKPGNLVLDRYFIQRRIAEGNHSKIFEIFDLDTGQVYALKAYPKKKLDENNGHFLLLEREKEIHSQMNHKNIVKLHQIKEDANYYFLILEYVKRGEFFNYLYAKDRLTETESARFFLPLLRALHYCHLKGVMHRDIKPENLLLTESFEIKLADFGWAIQSDRSNELCGTIEYLAPEVLKNCSLKEHRRVKQFYNYKIDIWALGILLYEFLYGCIPFEGENQIETAQLIVYQSLKIPDEPKMGDDVVDLLRRLLDKNPKTRISYIELLLNSWVSKYWETPFPQDPKSEKSPPNHNRSLSTEQ